MNLLIFFIECSPEYELLSPVDYLNNQAGIIFLRFGSPSLVPVEPGKFILLNLVKNKLFVDFKLPGTYNYSGLFPRQVFFILEAT